MVSWNVVFKLSKLYHPDIAQGPKKEAEAKYLAIRQAYEILGNDRKRYVLFKLHLRHWNGAQPTQTTSFDQTPLLNASGVSTTHLWPLQRVGVALQTRLSLRGIALLTKTTKIAYVPDRIEAQHMHGIDITEVRLSIDTNKGPETRRLRNGLHQGQPTHGVNMYGAIPLRTTNGDSLA